MRTGVERWSLQIIPPEEVVSGELLGNDDFGDNLLDQAPGWKFLSVFWLYPLTIHAMELNTNLQQHRTCLAIVEAYTILCSINHSKPLVFLCWVSMCSIKTHPFLPKSWHVNLSFWSRFSPNEADLLSMSHRSTHRWRMHCYSLLIYNKHRSLTDRASIDIEWGTRSERRPRHHRL
jgi:hypothetical protein